MEQIQEKGKPEELHKLASICLKSCKGDYLIHQTEPPLVITGEKGFSSEWTLETSGNGNVMLKSCKGDYLTLQNEPSGVTITNDVRSATEWITEYKGGKVKLKSCKGDYLTLQNEPSGVTTTNDARSATEWTVDTTLGDKNDLERIIQDEIGEEEFAKIMNEITLAEEMALPLFLKILEQAPTCFQEEKSIYKSEKITINFHPWGFDIIMNEELTQEIVKKSKTTVDKAENKRDMVNNVEKLMVTIVTLPGKLGKTYKNAKTSGLELPPPASTICDIIFISLENQHKKIENADNGKGVHWPVTWIQLAFITIGFDICTIYCRSLIALYPFCNK